MQRLVLFVLMLAVGGTAVGQEVHEESRGLFGTRQLQATVPMGREATLEIRAASTLRGVVEISVGDSDNVHLAYYKRAKTTSRSRAVDYIDLISVQLEQTPVAARLEMRAPNPAPWEADEAGLVHVVLTIPRNVAVNVDAAYFDISAVGPFSEFIDNSSLGRIDVSDVSGRVDIATANQKVSLAHLTGDVSATTSNASLLARDINCSDAQGSFRNEGGDIIIDGLIGELNVRTSYGRIDIDDLTPAGTKNYIRGSSGPILVNLTRLTDGQLILANRYDDIEIVVPTDISAVMALSVDEEGKIEANNFNFKTELVQTNRLNLVAGDGGGLISGSIRGKGNIYVRGSDEEFQPRFVRDTGGHIHFIDGGGFSRGEGGFPRGSVLLSAGLDSVRSRGNLGQSGRAGRLPCRGVSGNSRSGRRAFRPELGGDDYSGSHRDSLSPGRQQRR